MGTTLSARISCYFLTLQYNPIKPYAKLFPSPMVIITLREKKYPFHIIYNSRELSGNKLCTNSNICEFNAYLFVLQSSCKLLHKSKIVNSVGY